ITLGCDCSWLKKSIFCSLFSSKILKSFFVKFDTKRPWSSVTVTGTMTSLTEILMGACALATGRSERATASTRASEKAGLGRSMNDSVNIPFYAGKGFMGTDWLAGPDTHVGYAGVSV